MVQKYYGHIARANHVTPPDDRCIHDDSDFECEGGEDGKGGDANNHDGGHGGPDGATHEAVDQRRKGKAVAVDKPAK